MPSFVKYIIAIAIILFLAFLSQQAISGGFAKTFVYEKAQAFLSKGYNAVAKKTVDKVSGEVANGGEAIQQKVEQEKKNIAENISTKVSNYFSNVASALAGKNSEPTICPPVATTTPTN